MDAKAEDLTGLKVRRVSGAIGAEISGVRLAGLSDAAFAQIRQAFHDHCMLVFPGQHLSMEEHVAFAARWGPGRCAGSGQSAFRWRGPRLPPERPS